ncbi:MAG: protease modulator HflC [Kosmotoga sp.]|nr:MAG: protease modulator HflC [Kosmotoga sp.]
MKLLVTLVVIIVLALIIVPGFFYFVDEVEQAVVLRFGDIVQVSTEPGLYTKAPFIDNVVKFDKRIQLYDISAERIYTEDKKTLLVDTFAMWRIVDPEAFVKTMRTVNNALTRIDDVVYSTVRDTFGERTFDEIVSKQRIETLEFVTEQSRKEMQQFGLEILAVRVKKADLPEENKNAVFNRMESERNQEAARIRAEGEKEAAIIRAEADKDSTLIVAEANRESEILKGTGDASALTIYAEAYSEDEEFYEFWKSLSVYESTLKDSKFVLDSRMDFIKGFLAGE